MNNDKEVYVGESLNVAGRMKQHLESESKHKLKSVRVVPDDTFNKSACLDLESFLIRMFHGDASRQVLNLNAGITDAEYFDRENYTKTFRQIFEELRTQEDLFQRTIPQIINSDLFKLSPFKALNHDQAIAVEDILDGFFTELDHDVDSTAVVEGNPGTGKTVVAIYLLKLLEDIRKHNSEEPLDIGSIFSDYFTPGACRTAQEPQVRDCRPSTILARLDRQGFQTDARTAQRHGADPVPGWREFRTVRTSCSR
ncbi:DNA/RNA helicase domain-containing protein [Brevibacterium aurantiacum]|uniref:DNA/RNA helicase domain-containing protein n=1 Tax=Brevibacterium aurantiacum TaxID=273384 RepID=UPI001F0AB93F|nr:DNA/RNA helicase domain-containing protein [Brevibacterium aurantiacum]